MEITVNQPFHLLTEAYGLHAGLYRIILDDPASDSVACVLLRPEVPTARRLGGRPKVASPKRKNYTQKAAQVGAISWINRSVLIELLGSLHAVLKSLELSAIYYRPLDSQKDQEDHERRCKVMSQFLDYETLRESILVHRNMGGLIKKAMEEHNASEAFVRRQWSLLCTYGLTEASLRPRRDRCGAKGKPRNLSAASGRKKAGRKTKAQRLNKHLYGFWGEPIQQGMNDDWSDHIKAADKLIPTPKPSMRSRYDQIIKSHFAKALRFDESGEIEAVELDIGQYPNYQQVKRVLTFETTWIQKILDKTSKGHFKRALRGMTAKNWLGVSGPGHTYAIDSTIGDIYLRSSVNPAWIVGRPIVYIIVDVWSTAVVGFYVCLSGPSWDTAQISLFNVVSPAEQMSTLWDYEIAQALFPAPTLPYALLCDRGEYLSLRAKATGMKLKLRSMSYTPPYRPDLKGLVEVLHRIVKDAQFNFMPGTMDARRVEYDLRRSNPAEATMTVQRYTQYLQEVFFKYNLTADRSHRVDAHMAAQGVYPSPAGLWRWGHAMGIGYRKANAMAELVSTLLPSDIGRVTRSGIKYCRDDYQSPIADTEQWSTLARNYGGREIPIHPYPGSSTLVWTPSLSGDGMIELRISDQALTAPCVTSEEKLDAFAFQQLKKAEIDHQNTVQSVLSLHRIEAIKARSVEETRIALGKARGTQPSMTEARQIELGLTKDLGASEIRGSRELRDEAQEAHLALQKALVAEMNQEGEHGL
jgi:putative transposase